MHATMVLGDACFGCPSIAFWHMLLFVLVTGIAGWYGVYQGLVWLAELLHL